MAVETLIVFLFTAWWDWAGALSESRTWAVRQPLLESVLPIEDVWDVAGRSYRDLYVDERESWLCIGNDLEGRRVAEVRLPGETSLMDQLALAWLRDRERTFEELRPELSIERHVVPAEACPAIAEALAELETLELRAVVAEDGFILHPPVWEVHVPGLNQSLTVRSFSPDHPVAEWYDRTLAALLVCLEAMPEGERRVLPFPSEGPTVCGAEIPIR